MAWTAGGAGAWRTAIRCIGLNLVALGIVLSAGEVLARALPEGPVRESHRMYEPGRTFRYTDLRPGPGGIPEFDNEITLNRYGFHGPDHPPGRPDGVSRILVIGDSMVEGFQVPRAEGLGARMEELLPGIQVMTFGMSGHGTMKHGRILGRIADALPGEAGARPPEIIVFVIHGPYAVRQALVDFVRAPALWRRGLRWVLFHDPGRLRILRRVRDSLLIRLQVPTDDLLAEARRAFEPGYRSEDLDRAWDLLGGAMEAQVREARALGALPVFAYLPEPGEMGEGSRFRDPSAVARRFETAAKETGAVWVDLTEGMKAGNAGGGLYFTRDQHMTPGGHRWAARLLAERLAPLLGR